MWVGVSKWLSQVHGAGSAWWLMAFMNKMTDSERCCRDLLSLAEWHHQKNDDEQLI